MSENEDDGSLDRCPITNILMPGSCASAKSRTCVQLHEKIPFSRAPSGGNIKYDKNSGYASPAHWEFRKCPKKLVVNEIPFKTEVIKSPSLKSEKQSLYVDKDYVVSDCWRSNSDDIPVRFVEPFKESYLEEADIYVNKQNFDDADASQYNDTKSPPYTKEFHVLSEVQKARILKIVEDVVKKLATDDCSYIGTPSPDETQVTGVPVELSYGKVYSRKFSLPWVVIKVIEMVLCHIMQLIFLSDETYYEKKNEFLPVVFTYYLTLFIVLTSLVAQLSCFSYEDVQNPCYFMGVVSSCVLTLITTLGIMIMLTSMQYYKSLLQILVLVVVGVLLCVLFAELCLFYVEVKNVWNDIVTRDQASM